MDQISFQLILHAGNSRSSSMEALECAREGKFEEALIKLDDAENELNQAHHVQTKMLVDEAQGNKSEIGVLLIHAQDHFTAALLNLDLSRELVHMYRLLLNK